MLYEIVIKYRVNSGWRQKTDFYSGSYGYLLEILDKISTLLDKHNILYVLIVEPLPPEQIQNDKKQYILNTTVYCG